MNMYFICTGNTCRSPLAEALAAHAGIQAKSAGIYAIDGAPISKNSAQLLAEAGMPFTPHSNEVTAENMQWAHAVLTMTAGHRDALRFQFPEHAEKIATLKEYAGETADLDIIDPFGGSLALYRATFQEIEKYIGMINARQKKEDI